jgi:NTP pyrophosphatase (non-canonical NTP hydrolase)
MGYPNPHFLRGKSLADMTAEIRHINIEKGWRSAEGGPGANTFGDYVALLHSELSEALEAFRDWRLRDPRNGPKPEGVGSEFADVLIRLLDTCDVFDVRPFEMDLQLGDVTPAEAQHLESFGDWIAELHRLTAQLGKTGPASLADDAAYLLRALVATTERFAIDLASEYERKVTYNRTRSFRHGGRALTDANA